MRHMKMVMLILAMLACSPGTGWAQNTSWQWNERFAYAPAEENFRDQEFSVDLFGSYQRGQNKINDFFDEPEHGVWGGGVGFNYFFIRYLGIGADVMAHDNGRQFVDHASLSLIGRVPIGGVVAPYFLGGGGYAFDPSGEWTVHAGAGLEVRLNQHTGVFLDGRFVWVDDDSEFSVIRAGIRLAF